MVIIDGEFEKEFNRAYGEGTFYVAGNHKGYGYGYVYGCGSASGCNSPGCGF